MASINTSGLTAEQITAVNSLIESMRVKENVTQSESVTSTPVITPEVKSMYRKIFLSNTYKESELIQWIRDNEDKFRVLSKSESYDNGSTAIHFAAQCGHTELVTLLMSKYGINVNELNKNGYTPLNFASDRGHTEVVKLLLEAKADVNLANKDGETPLYWASRYGRTEIATLLRNASSVTVTVSNADGTTNSFTTTVKELFVGGTVEKVNANSVQVLLEQYSIRK